MRALVTGANGFLGSALVRVLLAQSDCKVRCLVRPRRGLSGLKQVQELFPGADIEYLWGDLTSEADTLEAVKDVDVVYHAAAAMKGSAADIFRNTVVGSKNLLEAIVRRNPVRIVLISSFGVYGTRNLTRGQVIDENTPLEGQPAKRDPYSHAKLRQEQLFWEYRAKHRFPLVVVRPGVIYGPGGTALPARVGLNLAGLFLHLGGRNVLPLTYVDNCAEAIVLISNHDRSDGQVYNVVDDDLPTSWEYFRAYRRSVKRLKFVRLPYSLTYTMAAGIEWYHAHSRGQIPAFISRYKVACMWKGNRFDNGKIKRLGWSQAVPTAEGLRRCFAYWRQEETVSLGREHEVFENK